MRRGATSISCSSTRSSRCSMSPSTVPETAPHGPRSSASARRLAHAETVEQKRAGAVRVACSRGRLAEQLVFALAVEHEADARLGGPAGISVSTDLTSVHRRRDPLGDLAAGLCGELRDDPFERALHDAELRENVRNAYESARSIYNELLGNRGVTGVATRVATDKDIQDELKSTIAELRRAADRVQGKDRHKARSSGLLLVGIGLGLLFNPISGPKTR